MVNNNTRPTSLRDSGDDLGVAAFLPGLRNTGGIVNNWVGR